MKFPKKILFAYVLYILATSLIFLNTNSWEIKNKPLKPFFQDSDISYKIVGSLALDPNTGSTWIPRAFHNKISMSFDSFTNSLFQSIDPVFLFSLSKDSPLYSGPTDVKMLFPFELPLFLLSLIYIIRNWKPKKDKYFYLFIFFLFSLLIAGFFIHPLHPLKLLPIVIVTRTIIFLGISDWVLNQKWSKKYFS